MTTDEFYRKWLDISLRFYQTHKTGYWKQLIEEQAQRQFGKKLELEAPSEELDF